MVEETGENHWPAAGHWNGIHRGNLQSRFIRTTNEATASEDVDMKFYKLIFSNVNNELEAERLIPNAEILNTIWT